MNLIKTLIEKKTTIFLIFFLLVKFLPLTLLAEPEVSEPFERNHL